MLIATCGYGKVGASAVLDYLRGYDDVQIIPFEFNLIHMADGLSDLKYYLTQSKERVACNAAIKRFEKVCLHSTFGYKLKGMIGKEYDTIVNDYLRDIIQVSWKGRSSYDPVDLSDRSTVYPVWFLQQGLSFVLKRIHKSLHFPRYRERYFSLLSEEEFDALTKQFLKRLLAAAGIDLNKTVVLDMLFSATNPTAGSEFFDDVKIIVVDRDPRDNYIETKRKDARCAFLPHDNAEDFAVYYQKTRVNTNRDENVLFLQFEDMTYRYEETTERLNAFLGKTNRPEKEFTYFDPDLCVPHTKLFEQYPKYEKDTNYLQEKLKDYLYDFTEYQPRKSRNR